MLICEIDFMKAERPIVSGRQYHIRCAADDVAPYILLPGDPARSEKIAELWEKSREVAFHREYRTFTGIYHQCPITVTSTGIGGPSLAIAAEELAALGCHTFLRVGSTGSLVKGIRCGDLIINTASVRLEGTSKQYVREEYPASAHHETVLALIEACECLGFRYHVGVGASTDSFYVGQGRHGFKNYSQSFSCTLLEDLQKANVLNFEMECATLFTLGNLYGLRCGAICAVFANRVSNSFNVKGEAQACKAACEAIRILYEWDEVKEAEKKRYFYPHLATKLKRNPHERNP
jgi:uridine phosphorylase